ncbi:flagellar protein FliT [Castellaniella sp.]|uniref:flagellar protein FliT n=1 Tax=Castellaniella sp. TaxID=1955812 RepID=UPI0035652C6B
MNSPTHASAPSSPIPEARTLLQYQNIALLSGKMLSLARTYQWDDLLGVYGHYAEAVHDLKDLPSTAPANQHQTRRLLHRTLEHDARLRALLNPEIARLGHLLGHDRRKKSLLRQYGAPQPTPLA